jgi:exodeoxyribonuclease VII small subunit
MSAKKTQSRSFEDSLKRLEAIVEALEQGNVPLDQAVELYEEGVLLSRECAEKLKAAELRIKRLAKNVAGQFEIRDLEEE